VKQQEQSSRQQQWQQQGRSPNGSSSSSGSKGSDTLCLPKIFAEMASKDVDDFLAQLWAMDGKAYGNCAGTCWMKQVGWDTNQIRVAHVTGRGTVTSFDL
jgi:hypothetical protein